MLIDVDEHPIKLTISSEKNIFNNEFIDLR